MQWPYHYRWPWPNFKVTGITGNAQPQAVFSLKFLIWSNWNSVWLSHTLTRPQTNKKLFLTLVGITVSLSINQKGEPNFGPPVLCCWRVASLGTPRLNTVHPVPRWSGYIYIITKKNISGGQFRRHQNTAAHDTLSVWTRHWLFQLACITWRPDYSTPAPPAPPPPPRPPPPLSPQTCVIYTISYSSCDRERRRPSDRCECFITSIPYPCGRRGQTDKQTGEKKWHPRFPHSAMPGSKLRVLGEINPRGFPFYAILDNEKTASQPSPLAPSNVLIHMPYACRSLTMIRQRLRSLLLGASRFGLAVRR